MVQVHQLTDKIWQPFFETYHHVLDRISNMEPAYYKNARTVSWPAHEAVDQKKLQQFIIEQKQLPKGYDPKIKQRN